MTPRQANTPTIYDHNLRGEALEGTSRVVERNVFIEHYLENY